MSNSTWSTEIIKRKSRADLLLGKSAQAIRTSPIQSRLVQVGLVHHGPEHASGLGYRRTGVENLGDD